MKQRKMLRILLSISVSSLTKSQANRTYLWRTLLAPRKINTDDYLVVSPYRSLVQKNWQMNTKPKAMTTLRFLVQSLA